MGNLVLVTEFLHSAFSFEVNPNNTMKMILVIVHQILQFSSYLIIIIIKHVQAPVYVFMITEKAVFPNEQNNKKKRTFLCALWNTEWIACVITY